MLNNVSTAWSWILTTSYTKSSLTTQHVTRNGSQSLPFNRLIGRLKKVREKETHAAAVLTKTFSVSHHTSRASFRKSQTLLLHLFQKTLASEIWYLNLWPKNTRSNMPRPLGEDLRWRIVWLRMFLGHRFRYQIQISDANVFWNRCMAMGRKEFSVDL